MTSNIIEQFIKIVEENSKYSKCVKINVIEKMASMFDVFCEKKEYSHKINNCLEIALQFYKQYNYNYYKMLIDGLKNKDIIIDNNIKNS